MTTSPLTSVQHIVHIMRRSLAEARGPQRRGVAVASKRVVQQQEARLSALVVQRMRALNPDDPQQQRKAFRIFLETLLLAELGEQLINDPAFQGMVDDIQTVMEQQTETQALIERAIGGLLGR